MASTCLFNSEYPRGKIFDDHEEPALLAQGWVDAEWKVVKGEAGLPDSEPEPLKPWQKAVAARKAKREANQE